MNFNKYYLCHANLDSKSSACLAKEQRAWKIVYLEPSHCPFICSMAVVASFFLTKETNPYPFDFPVTISLTTRQSLISPKGANAVLKVSVSISGDKSPTKMWWCWDVSTLPCCVPVELVAQLTWNKNWKELENHKKVTVKIQSVISDQLGDKFNRNTTWQGGHIPTPSHFRWRFIPWDWDRDFENCICPFLGKLVTAA